MIAAEQILYDHDNEQHNGILADQYLAAGLEAAAISADLAIDAGWLEEHHQDDERIENLRASMFIMFFLDGGAGESFVCPHLAAPGPVLVVLWAATGIGGSSCHLPECSEMLRSLWSAQAPQCCICDQPAGPALMVRLGPFTVYGSVCDAHNAPYEAFVLNT